MTTRIDVLYQKMTVIQKRVLFAVLKTLGGAPDAIKEKRDSLDEALFIASDEPVSEFDDEDYNEYDLDRVFDKDGVLEGMMVLILRAVSSSVRRI